MSTPDPERQQPAFMPPLEVVSQAYADILAHNEEHTGWGAQMSVLLKGLFKDREIIDTETGEVVQAPDPEADTDEDDQEQHLFAGDASAEIQHLMHGDILERIGISITPFDRRGTGDYDRTTSEPLLPFIANTELFKEFLKGLSKEDITKAHERILLDVLTTSARLVKTSARPDAADELKIVSEHTLRTFLSVQPHYERLGIDGNSIRKRHAPSAQLKNVLDGAPVSLSTLPEEVRAEHDDYNAFNRSATKAAQAYDSLHEYATYWGRDLLAEYVAAEEGQYILTPEEQRFGPAQWCYDTSEEHLREGWDKAFTFITELQSDKRTELFANEVIAALTISADLQIEWLSEKLASDDPNPKHFQPLLTQMQEVRLHLELLASKPK